MYRVPDSVGRERRRTRNNADSIINYIKKEKRWNKIVETKKKILRTTEGAAAARV